MTYQPQAGDKVTVRRWTTSSPEPGSVRHLHREQDGTVLWALPGMIQLAGTEEAITLDTHERDGAEAWVRYLVTEVHPQRSELTGRHVRIRRYVVSDMQARELDCDVEGTVRAVVERGRLVELDPRTAHVHYLSPGHSDPLPFGPDWRIGLDYVSLGAGAHLVTDVEVDPDDQVTAGRREVDRALELWEQAQRAEVVARQRLIGARERLEVIKRRAARATS